MDLEAFRSSLAEDEPPASLSLALQVLWWEGKGDWHRAHKVVQKASGRSGAWVHAYLHRVEGDLSNARYWYRRAGRPESGVSTAEEWAETAAALLASDGD